jgi:hypothetical protein
MNSEPIRGLLGSWITVIGMPICQPGKWDGIGISSMACGDRDAG